MTSPAWARLSGSVGCICARPAVGLLSCQLFPQLIPRMAKDDAFSQEASVLLQHFLRRREGGGGCFGARALLIHVAKHQIAAHATDVR